MITRKTSTRLGVLLAAAALVLTGCASTDPESAAEASAVVQGDSVTVSDMWVKSVDSGMSAAFGEVTNTSDEAITIVSAETDAAPMVELHETVESDEGEMVMQAKDGGFVIPAGGTLELAPGGNHIMLMGVETPIVAGEEVTVTLTFSDESTYEFTAPVKDYSGANENYVGEESDMDMDMDMEMGDDMSDHDMGDDSDMEMNN